ncbi:hypothetical protein Tco_0156059 [Tanacetum coccineum]
MTNLSICDSDVLSEVPYSDTQLNDMINQDVQEMTYSEQTHIDDFKDNEIHSDSKIIPYSQYLQESQDAVIHDTNSSAHNDLLVLSLVKQMTDHVAHLDKENQTNKMINESLSAELERYKEQTLILEEVSRSKMLDKQNDPISIEKKIKISPIDYSKLNKIKEDFSKRFVNKKELDAEQAFWLKHSNHPSVTPVVSHTPVKFKAPHELPKVSLANESLKKLKYQLANFDKVVKNRTTSNAITADIVHIAMNSIDILDVKKSCVDECNKCLKLETELIKKKDFIEKEVYDKLVKSYSTLEKHYIFLELETQLHQEIFQKDNSGENQKAPTFNQLFEMNELKAQSQEKDTVIRKLKDRIKSLMEKEGVKNVKKDIDEIDWSTAFAIATLKNELRKLKGENIIDTVVSKPIATISPRISKPSDTPKNDRIPQPSSSNKTNKVEDQFRSIKFRKNKKNRVDKTECNAHVMQSMLNANSVTEPINNALVKHYVSNAKFESLCAICNKCLFDANHDKCLIDYLNAVNVCSKSKSKINKKRNIWKPTGKVFTEIRYSWKPTRRIFTIVGNRCPLTRITVTKVVPTKETSTKSVVTPTQEILVYSKRPKATRSVSSSSKVKIVESKTSNSKEPKQSWGSTVSDVPSSSLNDCRLSKLFCGIWTPDAPSI